MIEVNSTGDAFSMFFRHFDNSALNDVQRCLFDFKRIKLSINKFTLRSDKTVRID